MGGARPPPFITFTITSKVAVYAPAECADTLTLFQCSKNMYSVVFSVTRPAAPHRVRAGDISACGATAARSASKVPKREIFDGSDFPDFYTIKSLRVGDFRVKIK